MKFTVKSLLERGYSQRAISKQLSISRKVVKKYFDEIQSGNVLTPQVVRPKILDDYHEDVKEWYSSGLTGVLILEKLLKEKSLEISYASISRYLTQFKHSEVYIPLIAKSGEEGQVDFGYLGKFLKGDKMVKVWCFSMVLSHSRYSFHCLVTDQSISTFIKCHIKSFEYFGGVPQTVKIDNLKAGVISANFYEPTIQRQYAEFLGHYSSAPITARVRRGQDKGKVEAGVKYVKSNFLKRVEHEDFYQLEKDLENWTTNICNKRLHGTTKKIPFEVFTLTEKKALKSMPDKQYEVLNIELRKVNNYGHISFKNNFYSVPSNYIGKTLHIKSNDYVIRIYEDTNQIAIHQICKSAGEFITKQEHLPIEKQTKTYEMYLQKANDFGADTITFLEKLKDKNNYNWTRIITGVFSLRKNYDIKTVNLACKRAIEYNIFSYSTVKNICKNGLYDKPKEELSAFNDKGYYTELKKYDQLFNNNNLNVN